MTNFDWNHNNLFKNELPNRLNYGFAKGAHNLGFVKFDNAGHLISETHAKELVNAIYENLLGEDRNDEKIPLKKMSAEAKQIEKTLS